MAIEQLVDYLANSAKPVQSRKWLCLKRRKPPQYRFPLREGASLELIEETGRRLSISIPETLRRAYSVMDGMDDYTGTNAGFMRLLPLSEWKLLSSVPESGSHPQFGRNVIISDYSIWAWWYAIELENPDELNWIRSFGGGDVWVVAHSFDEYLDLTLADDPILYAPRDDGSAA